MTKNKAQELFELYKEAELAGNDQKAKEIEAQLAAANWKIVYSPEWGIEKVVGLFSGWGDNNNTNWMLPNGVQTTPYRGTENTGSRTWVYVGIGLGVIALIVVTILIVRAVKKGKNGGLEQIQAGA